MRSMACGLGAQRLHFAFGEHARRLFCGIEDAVDERVAGRDAVALQPEEHVGLAAHGTDFDDLLKPEEMRRHTAVDGIGECRVFFVIGLDDRGGVDAGGGAEGIATITG